MRKYISRATKKLAIVTIISLVILLIGITFIVTNSFDIGLGLTLSGGLMSILFSICFLAEKSRYLIVEKDKIILPRGVNIGEKMSFQKTIIKREDIISIESKLYKGDGLIAKDTFFYILKLKNGTRVTFTMYPFGKEAEKEIIEDIKKNIL